MIQKINYADKQTGGKFSASDANEIKSTVNSNADVLSENSQSILSLQGGSLGPIKPTDAAPTPARNGNYTFSIGGAKPAWLTAEAGITTVKAGDGVAVVYTEPSSYTYTHVDTGSSIEQARSQSTSKVPSSKLVDDELNNLLMKGNNTAYLFDVKPSTNKEAILDIYFEKGKIYSDSIGIVGINANGTVTIYVVDGSGSYVASIGTTLIVVQDKNIVVSLLQMPDYAVKCWVVVDKSLLITTDTFQSKLSAFSFTAHKGIIGNVLKSLETHEGNSINHFLTAYFGYSINGGVTISGDGNNHVSSRLYVSAGDKIMYSGSFGYQNITGFKESGYITLLDGGTFDKKIITIPPDVIYVIANNDNSIVSDPLLKQINDYDSDYVNNRISTIESGFADLVNPDVKTLKDVTFGVYNGSYNSKTDRGVICVLDGDNANAQIDTGFSMIAGDYGFVRAKIKSNTSEWFYFTLYTDATQQTFQKYFLEANVEYEIYLRQNAVINAGNLNLHIGKENNAVDPTLTILDIIFSKNNLDVWYDLESKTTLKNFNTKTVVVDKSGKDCHFHKIGAAIQFLKSAHNVLTDDYVIQVRNGVYDKEWRTGDSEDYPYAAVNKEANRISIIGESITGTIIRYTNTATSRLKVVDHGGDSTIENISVECLNDGTYIDTSAGGHQACYCIHNDSSYAATKKYITSVRNVRLLSQCQSPIGAGLHAYQTQLYENVHAISDSINGTSAGAIYIHSSATTLDTGNQAVELINNEAISLDGTEAISLPDTGIGDSYTVIPCLFQKNILYSNGASETNVTDATHLILPYSKLNSNSILNK